MTPEYGKKYVSKLGLKQAEFICKNLALGTFINYADYKITTIKSTEQVLLLEDYQIFGTLELNIDTEDTNLYRFLMYKIFGQKYLYDYIYHDIIFSLVVAKTRSILEKRLKNSPFLISDFYDDDPDNIILEKRRYLKKYNDNNFIGITEACIDRSLYDTLCNLFGPTFLEYAAFGKICAWEK